MRPTSWLVVLPCVLLGAARAAAQQNVTLSFAQNAGGGAVFAGALMSDQFSPLGVHFNGSGVATEITGIPDGRSTQQDGFGGGNMVVASTNSGGNTFDTLRITFDTPQSAVQMDIDAGYLINANSVRVTLKSGGSLVQNMILTEGNEIGSCPITQTPTQLCGRFLLGGGSFDEIDITPTFDDPTTPDWCGVPSCRRQLKTEPFSPV